MANEDKLHQALVLDFRLPPAISAKTIEIEASHLALISHLDAVTNLILEALAV